MRICIHCGCPIEWGTGEACTTCEEFPVDQATRYARGPKQVTIDLMLKAQALNTDAYFWQTYRWGSLILIEILDIIGGETIIAGLPQNMPDLLKEAQDIGIV